MKTRRGAAFLLPSNPAVSPFADSPNQKSASRLPKIPDTRITAEEAAKRLREIHDAWPCSVKNYLKNLERIQKEK